MDQTVVYRGSGLLTFLSVLFIALKLTGVIAWSWIWVLALIWIGAVLLIVAILLVAWIGLETHDERLRAYTHPCPYLPCLGV